MDRRSIGLNDIELGGINEEEQKINKERRENPSELYANESIDNIDNRRSRFVRNPFKREDRGSSFIGFLVGFAVI